MLRSVINKILYYHEKIFKKHESIETIKTCLKLLNYGILTGKRLMA